MKLDIKRTISDFTNIKMAEEYIRNEYDNIRKKNLLGYIGCSAGPQNKRNIFKWNVLLKGPNKSCYENGLFKLSLEFPTNYPEEPPIINFVTKIYHPNISDNGAICVSSKSTDWNNHRNLVNVIYSIFDLLQKPNTDHGLNNEALLLYKNNKEEFEKKAREFTVQNAFQLCKN